MKIVCKILIMVLQSGILFLPNFSFAQNVEIKGESFYINGKKFFIKGIGYETHTRPGQTPWDYTFDSTLIKYDLQRIKNAGFNTLRTWGALKEEELKLVESSGLKILFGIWVDPAGDFGNPSFISSVSSMVNDVLSYSSRYKCIIGYLIMNEPQIDHIYQTGSQNLLSVWRDVKTVINQKHPGIPVSFSNATIGDFIDTNIFEFVSFNAYIYNPVTFSDSHGYSGYLKYLKNYRANSKPFLITEFGLSVSPGIPSSKYSYGGNSLAMQTAGDLLMYRGLIDAGSQGGCVFQYHDGWWKSGNPFTHENAAEEWFGLIEFANQSDRYGTPRPVWNAFEIYNRAIITNPKNENIYTGQIPVEIYTTDDVTSFTIKSNNTKLFEHSINECYFNGSFPLNFSESIKDYLLTFDFYNNNGVNLKSETISILAAKNDFKLPEIKMAISPSFLNPGGKNYLQYNISNNSILAIENSKIDYIIHPHIGFDAGTARSNTLTGVNGIYSINDSFDIPINSKVVTFGAGMTIRYNNFTKRITAQNILTSGSWANPIKASDVDLLSSIKEEKLIDDGSSSSAEMDQNYPNPFNPSTTISYEIHHAGNVKLEIYNSIGQLINILENSYQNAGKYKIVWDGKNISEQPVNSGIYFSRLSSNRDAIVNKMLLIK